MSKRISEMTVGESGLFLLNEASIDDLKDAITELYALEYDPVHDAILAPFAIWQAGTKRMAIEAYLTMLGFAKVATKGE